MKQFLLDFWTDSKALFEQNPWAASALIALALLIGFIVGCCAA